MNRPHRDARDGHHREADRKGKPSGLFWPWSAATVSVLAVSYGAFALGFGISWEQAIVVNILLGFDAVIRLSIWIMYISIILTVTYIALTINHLHLDAIKAAPSGNTRAVIGALIFLMAGGGLGWANAAADYSRYLPRRSSSAGVAAWTTIGLSSRR